MLTWAFTATACIVFCSLPPRVKGGRGERGGQFRERADVVLCLLCTSLWVMLPFCLHNSPHCLRQLVVCIARTHSQRAPRVAAPWRRPDSPPALAAWRAEADAAAAARRRQPPIGPATGCPVPRPPSRGAHECALGHIQGRIRMNVACQAASNAGRQPAGALGSVRRVAGSLARWGAMANMKPFFLPLNHSTSQCCPGPCAGRAGELLSGWAGTGGAIMAGHIRLCTRRTFRGDGQNAVDQAGRPVFDGLGCAKLSASQSENPGLVRCRAPI